MRHVKKKIRFRDKKNGFLLTEKNKCIKVLYTSELMMLETI